MSGNLGLSCPKGGSFYICTGNSTEFIGCCTVNPCGDGTGHCPGDKLAPATFSSDAYDDIPPQDCGAGTTGLWYTCKYDAPPFLGCCSKNPCDGGSGCPTGSLAGAALSHNKDYRQKFLLYAGQSTAGTSSPSSTPSSSSATPRPPGPGAPAASAQPQTQPVSSSSSLSGGAIAGIVIGAIVVLLAAVAALFCRGRRRKRQQSGEGNGNVPAMGNFDSTTAYHGSYRNSYNTAPTLAGNRSEIESPRLSTIPKPPGSNYSPETRQHSFPNEMRFSHNQWRPGDQGHPHNPLGADIAAVHEMEATPVSPTSRHTYQSREPPGHYAPSPPWSYNEQAQYENRNGCEGLISGNREGSLAC